MLFSLQGINVMPNAIHESIPEILKIGLNLQPSISPQGMCLVHGVENHHFFIHHHGEEDFKVAQLLMYPFALSFL